MQLHYATVYNNSEHTHVKSHTSSTSRTTFLIAEFLAPLLRDVRPRLGKWIGTVVGRDSRLRGARDRGRGSGTVFAPCVPADAYSGTIGRDRSTTMPHSGVKPCDAPSSAGTAELHVAGEASNRGQKSALGCTSADLTAVKEPQYFG